jgi:hypothetical protein
VLMAAESKNDLSLSYCRPQRGKKSPCVMLKSEEFFKALRDIEELRVRLKACEKNQ